MKSLRQTAMRLRGVFAGRRAEAELDEEVQLHLEMLALEHRNRGLSPDDAMLAARRDFGGVARMISPKGIGGTAPAALAFWNVK